MTSQRPYLLTPPPLGVRISKHEFWRDTNIHSNGKVLVSWVGSGCWITSTVTNTSLQSTFTCIILINLHNIMDHCLNLLFTKVIKLRRIEQFAQRHAASSRQSWDLNPTKPTAESVTHSITVWRSP